MKASSVSKEGVGDVPCCKNPGYSDKNISFTVQNRRSIRPCPPRAGREWISRILRARQTCRICSEIKSRPQDRKESATVSEARTSSRRHGQSHPLKLFVTNDSGGWAGCFFQWPHGRGWVRTGRPGPDAPRYRPAYPALPAMTTGGYRVCRGVGPGDQENSATAPMTRAVQPRTRVIVQR